MADFEFRNRYDGDDRPICPMCHEPVAPSEPAARAEDSITHFRCVWAHRRAQEAPSGDAELSAFFSTITAVLDRIRAVRAAIARRESRDKAA